MKFKAACDHSALMLQSDAFKERVIEEDELMLKYIPLLVKINNAGFLTNQSQGGHAEKQNLMERAFITGFMLESTAAEFIKYMGLYTDKNAAQSIRNDDDGLFKGQLNIPVTVQKLNKTEIDVFTHLSMGVPTKVFEQYLKQSKINKTEKVVFVVCWDPLWKRNAAGRKGLFTEVLKILLMLKGAPTRNTLHPNYTRKSK